MSEKPANTPVLNRIEPQDNDWVTVKIRLRPHIVDVLKAEAQRESADTGRQVYLTDLVREGIQGLLKQRKLPTQRPKFFPSELSERD